VYLLSVLHLVKEDGMYGFRTTSMDKYIINVENGTVSPVPAAFKDLPVFVFDSLAKGGYGWPAGEGIGTAGPVHFYDMSGASRIVGKNMLDSTLQADDIIEGMDVMGTNYGFITKEATSDGL